MLDNNVNSFDVNGLSALKRAAHDNSPEAIKTTAKQFEAVFLQMVLKAMRDASPKDGMFVSDATRSYQSMSDQQLAAVLAQKGGLGLAASIERQLMRQAVSSPDAAAQADEAVREILPMPTRGPVFKSPASFAPANANPAPAASAQSSANGDPQRFVESVWPQATEAARSLGVPAHFLVAQAALETGWGKSELRTPDGQTSYNLFNVKAGKNWTGATVDAQTTEYENGSPVTRTERFRAYGSYAEAFQDYARMMQNSPRYAGAIGQGEAANFARALQSGGYATDPAYADKLTRVINGNTLRQSLIASASGS